MPQANIPNIIFMGSDNLKYMPSRNTTSIFITFQIRRIFFMEKITLKIISLKNFHDNIFKIIVNY